MDLAGGNLERRGPACASRTFAEAEALGAASPIAAAVFGIANAAEDFPDAKAAEAECDDREEEPADGLIEEQLEDAATARGVAPAPDRGDRGEAAD